MQVRSRRFSGQGWHRLDDLPLLGPNQASPVFSLLSIRRPGRRRTADKSAVPTLRLCSVFLFLAVLVPVYSVQACTQFTGLYRYEFDPWGGTNVHDARIEMSAAGDQAYTDDEAVAALVHMNGYADGDWKRVKFFDPEQGVVFDRMTTYEGSTNCFVFQT